jgi:hypothetical protein
VDTRFLLLVAFLAAVFSIGLTSFLFRSDNTRKGMGASQWLLAALMWVVIMVIVLIREFYF